MATTYTSLLKVALPTQGELDGTWGTVVNENITAMFEEAIAGMATIDVWVTDSHTLTTANGTTSEARAAVLTLTDTTTDLSGAGTLIVPTSSKVYIVKNDTGQAITVKPVAGTGISVADGVTETLYCDGTNVLSASTANSTATATTEGIVELATQAEINTGTDAARVPTAATLTGFAGSMESVVKLGALSLRANAVTLSGTTVDMDCAAAGYFTITLTGGTTFTVSNVPATGTGVTIYLKIIGASTYTSAYPASFLWAGGTAPTTVGAGETDFMSFTTIDGGTTWLCTLLIDAAA